MPRGVAGDADLGLHAQRIARFIDCPVILPQMHTIRLQSFGERDVIIDDEGDLVLGTHGAKRFAERGSLVLAQAFDPKLEGGDVLAPWPLPRLQRAGEPVREIAADIQRRDQVKLRRHVRDWFLAVSHRERT